MKAPTQKRFHKRLYIYMHKTWYITRIQYISLFTPFFVHYPTCTFYTPPQIYMNEQKKRIFYTKTRAHCIQCIFACVQNKRWTKAKGAIFPKADAMDFFFFLKAIYNFGKERDRRKELCNDRSNSPLKLLYIFL